MRRALLPLLLLLLLTPTATRAATDFPLPLASAGRQPPIVESWTLRILKAREEVQKGKVAQARRRTESAIDDMLRMIERGRSARLLLGSAVYVGALAEVGLGRDTEAIWDSGVAFALVPEFRDYEATSEGAVGARLQSLIREEEERFGAPDSPKTGSKEGESEDVTPPRRLDTPAPLFPEGKRRGRVQSFIAVQVVIDKAGHVHLPGLLEGDDPSLIYSGLEALRKWRFAPAQAGGKPVSVHHRLTINYLLTGGLSPT